MSLYTFNFNSTYSVQIISAVWREMAYSIPCMSSFLSHSRHKKLNYKLQVGLPRISYRTNLFQQHTCHTF